MAFISTHKEKINLINYGTSIENLMVMIILILKQLKRAFQKK